MGTQRCTEMSAGICAVSLWMQRWGAVRQGAGRREAGTEEEESRGRQ